MPIKGLSETRRIPRLGKLHLGIKAEKKNDAGEVVSTYPKAVPWFVCPPEVVAVFGEQPTTLDIMFPVEDPDKFAPQNYKCYSSSRGLVCKGDGEKCMRLVDVQTGDFAHRDSKETTMREAACQGEECPEYQAKKCKAVMNLQLLLPDVPGLGVYQLDTSSVNSIIAVNSALDLIKSVCGRISMIPLKLTLEPKEVQADGKKKTVHVLNLRTDITLAGIQKFGALPPGQVLLLPPDEDKPELLFEENGEPAKKEDPDWAAMKRDKPQDAPQSKTSAPAAEKVEVANKPAASVQPAATKQSKAARAPSDPSFEPAEGGLRNCNDLFQAAMKRYALQPKDVEQKLGKTKSQFSPNLFIEWEALKAAVK